jgi:hypothetical protein
MYIVSGLTNEREKLTKYEKGSEKGRRRLYSERYYSSQASWHLKNIVGGRGTFRSPAINPFKLAETDEERKKWCSAANCCYGALCHYAQLFSHGLSTSVPLDMLNHSWKSLPKKTFASSLPSKKKDDNRR